MSNPHHIHIPHPLDLTAGGRLESHTLAYSTYGHLNEAADNAILVCHTMTTDSRCGGDPGQGERAGWWFRAIGPGRMLDTDRYFVVCPNVLGGCGGSSGPSSLDPARRQPYGLRFPRVSIQDMVLAQLPLREHLGIRRWHTIIGGCMGGFLALVWATMVPDCTERVVAIGCGARSTVYSIAFFEVLRQAIYLDPEFRDGDYYGQSQPLRGMALSAALGTLFWMTPDFMDDKYPWNPLASGTSGAFSRDPGFAIEGFIQQTVAGVTARNFDPNTMVYTSRACADFQLGSDLPELFRPSRARYQLVSYERDLRYPPEQMEELERALREADRPVVHTCLASRLGHAAFLFDVPPLQAVVTPFLEAGPAETQTEAATR